jgi:hypothetical protein
MKRLRSETGQEPQGETTATHWRSMEPFAFREPDYHFRGTGEWAGSELRI